MRTTTGSTIRQVIVAMLLLAHAGGARAAEILAPEALAVRPGAYMLDPAHGKITFTADHLGFSQAAGQDFADGTYTLGFSGRALLHRSEYGMGRLVPFIGDDVQFDFEGEFKPAKG